MKILLLLAVAACGVPANTVVSDVTAGVTLAACVISHDTEPPLQIAVDCAASLADVTKVLDADKASKVRAQCATVPASPGK